MEPYYEGTFWLSVALSSILVPLYVLAVSHVPQAREIARAEEQAIQRDTEAELSRLHHAIAQTTEQLRNARQTGDIEARVRELEADLQRLRGSQRAAKKRRARAKGLSASLGVARTVLYPGAFLLASAFLSVAAKAADSLPSSGVLWAASLVSLSLGVYLLISCLRGVQTIVDLAAPAVPICEITPHCAEAWIIETENKISFDVVLRSGTALKMLQVALFIPPTFRSSARPNRILEPDHPTMPGYQAIFSKTWPSLKEDMVWHYEFDRIRATVSGTFTIYYRLSSEEYSTSYRELSVAIAPQPAPRPS